MQAGGMSLDDEVRENSKNPLFGSFGVTVLL